MKVLVDTSIWSLVLRKQTSEFKIEPIIQELTNLIRDYRVAMIGIIRQEILSGIKSIDQFEKLKGYLKSFPDLTLETNDFELAAALYNQCQGRGVQGSHVDFLISAAAINREFSIFTQDRDFEIYAKYIPLKLHTL